MSYIVSMQNTDTTYIPSDEFSFHENPCWITQTKNDSLICIPLKTSVPIVPLNKTRHTAGCLLYAVVFLIIFAFLRIRGKGLINIWLQILAKKKKFEIVLNDGITPNLVYYLLSLSLSFSAIAIGIDYLVYARLEIEHILYIFIALSLYHIILIFIIYFIGWTFNRHHASEEIIINLWVYHILAGLSISPFILALFFVKIFAIPLLLKMTTICLILFYLVKFTRWLKILYAHRVSIFYMILYLCALEVIPLLILYKLLVY